MWTAPAAEAKPEVPVEREGPMPLSQQMVNQGMQGVVSNETYFFFSETQTRLLSLKIERYNGSR